MTPETFDDPFADLFGRLPDAREGESARRATPAASASTPEPQRAPQRRSTPAPEPQPAPSAAEPAAAQPMTRRAAREAAARRSTPDAPDGAAETPAAPQSAPAPAPATAQPQPAAQPQPQPAAQPDVPAADEASRPIELDATLLSAPRPVAVPVADTSAPSESLDSWEDFIGAAGAAPAPALPYSRTGATGPTPTPAGGATPARATTPTVAAAAETQRPTTASLHREPSLEDLFGGTSSTDDIGSVPPPPDRRKRRIGGWIALGVVLVILGGIAAGGLWVWNTYEEQIREVMGWEEPKDYEAGLATGEALITISSGDVPGDISQTLYEAGVTKTPEAFYDMLIDSGQNPTFYPGVYQLQQKMTSTAALKMLQDPANKLENSALLPEGLTVAQSLPILADGLGIPLKQFNQAVKDPSQYGVSADSLEGWLFPALYEVDPGTTAKEVIQRMVDRTVQSLDTAGVPKDKRQRILTIASIIQREARFEADFYKVSRVIENRLDTSNQETFGLLQMDSTAQYGFGEMHNGSASTSEEAQYDDNPWNTYVHEGLPKGPIANPGDVAIDAAMHPADGPWLYFVTVNMNTGETIFTETYSEHLKYVDQMLEWCSAHPNSGC